MKKDARQRINSILVRRNEQCFVKRFQSLALPRISKHMWPNSRPYCNYSCNLHKAYAFPNGCIHGKIQTPYNVHIQVDGKRSIC